MSIIEARKQDIQHYQVNIDNYTEILKLIPSVLPSNLIQYANSTIESLFDKLCFDDIQKISDYQFRKKIEITLITERLEQRKSKLVLQAILIQNKG
jgi:hypothetical protein